MEGGLVSGDQRGTWDAVPLQPLPEAQGTSSEPPRGGAWRRGLTVPGGERQKAVHRWIARCREWGFLQGQRAGPTQHQRLPVRTKASGCWTCWTEQAGF